MSSANQQQAGGQSLPLTRVLGAASLALGLPALVAPRTVERLIGLLPSDGSDAMMRAVGVQEISVGAALLTRRRPVGFQWSRVAGDIAHLSMLANALAVGKVDRRKVARTATAVAAITVVDLVNSIKLTRTSDSAEATMKSRTAITVNRPPTEVYAYWRDFSNLPDFMYHLEEVRPIDDRRSHWVAKAPAGATVEWDAEIVEEAQDEVIAWRSVQGAAVPNAGSVRFAPAPAQQGTEILVEIEYSLPGGRIGAAVARLFGEDPEQQMRDDLRRFKQVLETGQVVISDGLPEGTRSARQLQLLQRPAQPSAQGQQS